MKHDYLPRKETEFCSWLVPFFSYLNDNLQRFGIDISLIATITALRSDFEQKYETAIMPSTRTKGSVQAKNDALDALKAALRVFIREYLTYNHLVTDKDRDNLGIPIHRTGRRTISAPATYPVCTIDTSLIRFLIIHFRDVESSGKGKPFGVYGAEIRWGFSDAPVVDVAALPHSAFDTRTPFKLGFRGDERGHTVWFSLRWLSRRGKGGPWSQIYSAIIP
ncbi:MAG: hypothetical protein LBP64_06525 [Tannerella sp.]|jgi:hypothetical protein|nr:hypothetical protein [Tannerella sp.]